MRHKEFKERVEDWGRKYNYETDVEIGDSHTCIKVESNGWFHLNTHISNTHRFVLDTDWIHFRGISELGRAELFDIIVELAKTPIEERKEEKKYYVRLPWLEKCFQYLNLNKSTGSYFAATKSESFYYQVEFTMEEIDEMKKKYNLDSFEIVEVE